MPQFVFSTDLSRLDADWVHHTLAEHAYWAQGRSREKQDAANAASRCYAVHHVHTGAQVAFARVVTDEATFAWLCDVIVDRELVSANLTMRRDLEKGRLRPELGRFSKAS